MFKYKIGKLAAFENIFKSFGTSWFLAINSLYLLTLGQLHANTVLSQSLPLKFLSYRFSE